MDELQIVAMLADLPMKGLLCFAIYKLWNKIEKNNGHITEQMDRLIDQKVDRSEDIERRTSDARYKRNP